ncbi:hypothetical protein J6590_024334 [Homalodisca vitripennis]|nr:hypothetical protein J6590_024334 [Homalodisca vitripennis]
MEVWLHKRVPPQELRLGVDVQKEMSVMATREKKLQMYELTAQLISAGVYKTLVEAVMVGSLGV